MFGDKARRIEELEAAQNLCEQEHGPFIPLAKEIGSRIVAGQQGDSPPALHLQLEQIVNELTIAGRRRFVVSQFESLNAADRWNLLGRLFDDEELKQYLAQDLERTKAIAASANNIALFAVESQRTQRIDLALLSPGIVMHMDLYDIEDMPHVRDIEARRRFCESVDPERQIVAEAIGDGRFIVIDDKYDIDDDSIGKPELKGRAPVIFGSGMHGGKVLTNVYAGSAVSCLLEHRANMKELWLKDTDDRDYDVELVLGQIYIENEPMF